MRKAPFAFTCIALLLAGWHSGTYADEAQAVTPLSEEPAGYINLGDETPVEDWISTPSGSGFFDRWNDPVNYAMTPPFMYFQADVLWLQRSRHHEQVLTVDDFNGQSTVLTTSDVDFNNKAAAGPLFTLGFKMDPESAFEFTYFGLNHWANDAQAFGPGNLSIPGPLALTTSDFFLANSVDVSYRSTMNNLEINYRQTLYNVTTLVGFRYLNMQETFNMRSTSFDVGNTYGDYTTDANNNLVGGQVGIGLNRTYNRFTIDFLSKAGLYANIQSQTTFMGDLNNAVVLRHFKNNSSVGAFIGEVGLNASYQLTTWLAVRGGYRIMWLDGMVLAPNQVNLSNDPDAGKDIQDRASVRLHGANVGLEARW